MKSQIALATGTLLFATLAALLWSLGDLFVPAKIALIVFMATALIWTFTRVNAAWVALVAVLLLAVSGATSQQMVYEMLGLDVIWLMIGAFVIGSAIEQTGLAERLAGIVSRRARSSGQLFWLTTALLVPFTFLVPSTSGRAATMLPLMQILPEEDGRELRRAYGLLIPVVILLTTSAALTGAGSHLVIEELLVQRLGDRFGFGNWALWGVPFAAASGALACWAILRMFLSADQRRTPLAKPAGSNTVGLSGAECRTVSIVAATLVLWLTAGWHELGIAMVAIVAMLALTAPKLGAISFKQAIKAVNWSLIVFVGAAMVLGRTLIDTQAAPWAMATAFDGLGMDPESPQALPEWAILLGIGAVTMGSHLVITSHVARAAALGPPLLLFAQTAGIDPVAVLFISAVGINYCITLPVCSKALMVFQDDRTGGGFTTADLVRLSAVLALPYLALMAAAYYAWWKWTGLSLI